jgi:putative tryptophan/tyrosine transport system substrate-binding protein
MWLSRLLVLLIVFAVCIPVEAQQAKKVPRIGILKTGVPSDINVAAFRQGLRDLGYIEGQNIIFEYRWADRDERLPDLAAELVRLRVDVIVTGANEAFAAKQSTKTIPIVLGTSQGPVETGLVASLAHPGGNITGMSVFAPELWPKRLELTKETIPKLSRVAMLWNRGNPAMALGARGTEEAAKPMGIAVQDRGAQDPNELGRVFEELKKDRPDALLTMIDPFTNIHLREIVDFTNNIRLPGIYDDRRFVEAGGLMSYGPNVADVWRHSATFVDKILKGAKPADLPVEQPIKFELFINLKTANQIGVTIPPSVLFQADKVIR